MFVSNVAEAGCSSRVWTTRAVDAMHALAACTVLFLVFSAWVHYALSGHYSWAVLPGANFGQPASLYAAGMTSVERVGHDGQFYYFMANDPFASGDAKSHMTDAPYRYQRIGIPIFAWALARCLGVYPTPAFLYHLVNFAFIAIGLSHFFVGCVGMSDLASTHTGGCCLLPRLGGSASASKMLLSKAYWP